MLAEDQREKLGAAGKAGGEPAAKPGREGGAQPGPTGAQLGPSGARPGPTGARPDAAPALEIALGDVLVRTQATKFKKLKFQTHENVGYGEIDLPPEEMHTRAAVLLLPGGTAAGASFEALGEADKPLVLQRLGTLVRNVAPVFLLCDLRDLGVAERLRDPTFGCPALYVYDAYPGGTGLAEGFLSNAAAILAGALELVSGCACSQGCPSCIGPAESERPPSAGFAPAGGASPKAAVVRFLRAWVAAGEAP
jgi:DEAD/DEAH box helicase domain-containing protein